MRERGRKRKTEREGAFYFEFQRPLNKFALSRAPSTVKKFIGRLHALIGDVYRAAIFSSWNTARARTPFLSVVDAAISPHARARSASTTVCPFLPFLFLFSSSFLIFFFRFSVTASESPRPVDAEIVEIDRPTDRPADRSSAARPTSVSARNPVKYTTVAFSVASECNVNWNMILLATVHRGREEKKEWHSWSEMSFYACITCALKWLPSCRFLRSFKILVDF